MSSKDSHLYGLARQRNLNNGKEISSSTTLSFTSQLTSLINSSSSNSKPTSSGRSRPKKDDIFATHNRNSAKRAKRDLEPDNAGTFTQKHSTSSEAVDKGLWERSKRKMEEKARLYAAMKRGDVEDSEERYAVDFDAKWAQGKDDREEDLSEEDEGGEDEEQVEYIDEFGRSRMGSRLDALRAKTQAERTGNLSAKPAAPAEVIYGDTIQHQAFNPDEPIAVQMEELARKRDKSLTPPPEEHFDSRKEVRTKGTGFFQFSEDGEERQRQMQNLEQERAETERVRKVREGKMNERKAQIEARREEIRRKNAKRKADEFLEELGREMNGEQGKNENEKATVSEEDEKVHEGTEMTESEKLSKGTEMTDRIEAAIQQEQDDI